MTMRTLFSFLCLLFLTAPASALLVNGTEVGDPAFGFFVGVNESGESVIEGSLFLGGDISQVSSMTSRILPTAFVPGSPFDILLAVDLEHQQAALSVSGVSQDSVLLDISGFDIPTSNQLGYLLATGEGAVTGPNGTSVPSTLDTAIVGPLGQQISVFAIEGLTIDSMVNSEQNGQGRNGFNLYVTTTPTGTAPVPEPGSLLLMGTGLLSLVGFNRRLNS